MCIDKTKPAPAIQSMTGIYALIRETIYMDLLPAIHDPNTITEMENIKVAHIMTYTQLYH